MATAAQETVLLAGYYNPEKRAKQVHEKLDMLLDRFMKLDFSTGEAHSIFPPDETQKEDTIDSLEEKVDNLKTEVKAYPFAGGHFTKQYRTFQGGFDKLLQKLDSLPIEDDQAAKRRRTAAIKSIQATLNDINGKMHPDGKCCVDCELHGTIWG